MMSETDDTQDKDTEQPEQSQLDECDYCGQRRATQPYSTDNWTRDFCTRCRDRWNQYLAEADEPDTTRLGRNAE